ncbi:MAG: hypothetical protein AB7Y46_19755 [Armatimonadota bacterium]
MPEGDGRSRPIPWWRTPGALILWAIVAFALFRLVLGPAVRLLLAAVARALFGEAPMSP